MRITPEIHKRVEEKVKLTVDKINAHYAINMSVPAIFYDVHSTNGGVAKYASMSVHFNPTIMEEDLDHYIKTTVPHEVCHIGVWQKYLKENKKNRSQGAWRRVETDDVGSRCACSPHT